MFLVSKSISTRAWCRVGAAQPFALHCWSYSGEVHLKEAELYCSMSMNSQGDTLVIKETN